MYLPLFCIPLFQILLFTMARESPFTNEQEAWIIIQFGKLERPVKVRRKGLQQIFGCWKCRATETWWPPCFQDN